MPHLLLAVLLLAAAPAQADGALRVFVGVVPYQTFVEQVGGERVTVQALVGPGFNPHTFEPGPRQVAALGRAELYVRAGLPFEAAWLERIRAVNPRMVVVNGGAEQPHGHGGADHHHGAGHGDPHRWTDPLQAKATAGAIRDALTRLDAAGAAAYAAGYEALATDLDALHGDLTELLADLPQRRFMVYHPAWGHFAARYGLTQVAIEKEGKEPGPRSLARIIDRARADGIRVILVQPQTDARLARRVAQAIGARVEEADPLAPDYAANLRRVAGLIAGAAGP